MRRHMGKAEKEALKIYLRHYGTMQEAITNIEADRKRAGISNILILPVRSTNNRK